MIEMLPDHLREEAIKLCEYSPRVTVNKTVSDGEILPYCGGIQVLHTPGHTEGHISLYHEKSKTLIAADSMLIVNDKLHGPVQQTSIDIHKAQQSVRKFLNYDIDNVICYHGGLLELNVEEQIKEIVQEID